MKCRHCHAELLIPFVDLGKTPPSNAYLTKEKLARPEKRFPLKVMVCHKCWLVQTEDCVSADKLFDDEYAYFSSYSAIWLEHVADYVEKMVGRFALNEDSFVIEIAANDGCLLERFRSHAIPLMGIEPTRSTADTARARGIEILGRFFGNAVAIQLAAQGRSADLMVANNVVAHVPDINDFVSGFATLLKSSGVATFEFPHLVRLVEESQFDTIYHEHYSYLSMTSVDSIFESNGLRIFDVERLPTHGGSLRVFAQRADSALLRRSSSVDLLLEEEARLGVGGKAYYAGFQRKVARVREGLLDFLENAKQDGKRVAAYGAAAKGNTLLNVSGAGVEMIPYVVDRSRAKQGKFTPGSRIPIVEESRLKEEKPDYILILPWNLREEIMGQLDYARAWGGKFALAVPELTIL